VQVTILCEDAAVGDTGVVDGVTYTKVDRAGLDVLAGDKSKWPMLATSCTSGVNDTSRLFKYKGYEFDQFDEFDVDISSWDTSSVTNMEDMFVVRVSSSRVSLLLRRCRLHRRPAAILSPRDRRSLHMPIRPSLRGSLPLPSIRTSVTGTCAR
jgi:hypothetical protein